MSEVKTCSDCKIEKPITEFSKNQWNCKLCAKIRRELRKQADPEYFSKASKKHFEENKETILQHNKEYRLNNAEKIRQYYIDNIDKYKQYYAENREKRIEYYQNNRERYIKQMHDWNERNKERITERRKQYDSENKDRIRERNRQHRLNNPEKYKERNRNRYQANKEYYRIALHKRRARILNAEGSHTKADIDFLFESQKRKCAICQCSIKDGYHVDHKTPLSKGGSNSKENLQLTCNSCNCSKGNKDEIEFMQSRGFLF